MSDHGVPGHLRIRIVHPPNMGARDVSCREGHGRRESVSPARGQSFSVRADSPEVDKGVVPLSAGRGPGVVGRCRARSSTRSVGPRPQLGSRVAPARTRLLARRHRDPPPGVAWWPRRPVPLGLDEVDSVDVQHHAVRRSDAACRVIRAACCFDADARRRSAWHQSRLRPRVADPRDDAGGQGSLSQGSGASWSTRATTASRRLACNWGQPSRLAPEVCTQYHHTGPPPGLASSCGRISTARTSPLRP